VFPPLNPVTPGHLLVVPGEHDPFNVPAAAVIAGAAALRTEMRTGTEDLQDLARAVLEDAGRMPPTMARNGTRLPARKPWPGWVS
jgi:hypothetical protein